MARQPATNRVVPRAELEDFIRGRHQGVLSTARLDGRPQMSPVTMGLDLDGTIVIATYPRRAKAINARRQPEVSVCVLSDDFGGEWVQVYGSAEVLGGQEAVEPLVDYFRVIAGEHPNWDEYRQAMIDQDKVLLRVEIESWGPISRGGFPPHLADG
ncbi:MAG: PPOX class F420-dependent oxidoreductase [Acidimicrobiia bacterium]|nr:PPOX class F420-dependent oxidoreductase [Acidimicrobiia bacterium]MDH5422146.1 PPOX class F420-dependent oxidoreductase [Acidimicrobiia bacterium]MDH5503240.1 PPOX class F420-dependent oxidoreductase [Acidimicrobiia bacterium]